jgi:hypothetical protein
VIVDPCIGVVPSVSVPKEKLQITKYRLFSVGELPGHVMPHYSIGGKICLAVRKSVLA